MDTDESDATSREDEDDEDMVDHVDKVPLQVQSEKNTGKNSSQNFSHMFQPVTKDLRGTQVCYPSKTPKNKEIKVKHTPRT